MLLRIKFCIVAILFVSTAWSGALEETIKAFESRPDYVRPFATLAGTMTNAGWYQSATIGRPLGFSFSLPVSLVYLHPKDREYDGTYIDENCRECREMETSGASVDCGDCVECQDFTAPTIFGSIRTPQVSRSIIDGQHNVVESFPHEDPFSDGVQQLRDISVLPYVTLQGGISYYHTELKLRYMGIPPIGGISFHFPGVGIQHDFKHLLPAAFPVSLSLAAHVTFLNVSWEPKNDIEGTLELDGISNFLGIIAGYTLHTFADIFIEAGWDNAFLESSGELIVDDEPVRPRTRIPGRNGFRIALNIALPRKYNPTIGGIAGAQFGNTINLISFHKYKK